MAKKGLGKGLEAIFGNNLDEVLTNIQDGNIAANADKKEIPIDKIHANPYQPRKNFDENGLEELANSIAVHGVFTPILVRKSLDGFQLIAGERRLRASKKCDKQTIPAIVVDFDDQTMAEIALLENIQREDLSPIEEALAYEQMIQRYQYTQEQLAARVGKSRPHITNLLRLLKLPKKIQDYVVNQQLSMGHIRSLITIENKDQMDAIAKKAVDQHLSVRQVEQLVKDSCNFPNKKTIHILEHDYRYLEEKLQEKLQTEVKVAKHQLTIKFTSKSDLNRILAILNCLEEE